MSDLLENEHFEDELESDVAEDFKEINSFEELEEVAQIQTMLVPVPAWKCKVWVRGLSLAESQEIMRNGGKVQMNKDGSTVVDLSDIKNGDTLLASYGLVTDKTGEAQMIRNDRRNQKLYRQQMAKLASLGKVGIDPIIKAIRQLSAMGETSEEQKKP